MMSGPCSVPALQALTLGPDVSAVHDAGPLPGWSGMESLRTLDLSSNNITGRGDLWKIRSNASLSPAAPFYP